MRKGAMILLSAVLMVASIALMDVGERTLTAGAFTVMSLFVVLLHRRFGRSASHGPWIFHAAAAIGATLGVVTLLSGAVHSAAVTAVALDESEWAALTILRFTTGAMLMYAGAMSVALHRAIRSGRRWALGVCTATSLLFWSHLMLLFPLPGTRGTVPPMLGLWSAYLIWLGAAFLATVPRGGALVDLGQQVPSR